jgi:hypothetical protein
MPSNKKRLMIVAALAAALVPASCSTPPPAYSSGSSITLPTTPAPWPEAPPPVFTIPETVAPIERAPSMFAHLSGLADLIAFGESYTAGHYNAANAGSGGDLGSNGLIKVLGRDCSKLTIGQVMAAQAQGRLHAVGRYQIIGSTMRAAVSWAGLKRTDLFTPANQDRLLLALLEHKRPEVWSFLRGRGSLSAAINGLAMEWSSLPAASGGSYYGEGVSANAGKVRRVLLASRANLSATPSLSGS